MSDKLNAIRRQFNRSAGGDYDRQARVQRIMASGLASSIAAEMDVAIDDSSVLEIGCGTGVLTEHLVQLLPPFAELTALDLAPAMLDAAARRIHNGINRSCNELHSRVRFIVADVESWAAKIPSASFNLIVSNACFQWLAHPQATLQELRRLLRPGGLLVFTTFGSETFHELHASFDDAYRSLGLTPQRHGLTFHNGGEWHRMLEQAGFSNLRFSRSLQLEKYVTVRDFLQTVKAVGASTSEADDLPGFGNRRLFARMFHAYEQKFGLQDGIVATYDLLMLEATASME